MHEDIHDAFEDLVSEMKKRASACRDKIASLPRGDPDEYIKLANKASTYSHCVELVQSTYDRLCHSING
jgi:hypothetical protein